MESDNNFQDGNKHNGLSLKELLSQGIENPFGLHPFCGELSSGNIANACQVSSHFSPSDQREVVAGQSCQSLGEDKDSLHSLLSSLDIRPIDGNEHNSQNPETHSSKSDSDANLKHLDIDFGLNVSEIVNEVLKEEDKSYTFEENPDSTNDNYRHSQKAKQVSDFQTDYCSEVITCFPTGNQPKILASSNLNYDCSTSRFSKFETNKTNSTKIRTIKENSTSKTIKTGVHPKPPPSQRQFKMVKVNKRSPKRTSQSVFGQVQNSVFCSYSDGNGRKASSDSSENHIILSASQMFITHLFPSAVLSPQPNGGVKVIPARAEATTEKLENKREKDSNSEDESIDCRECGRRFTRPCSLHTLALILDNPVLRNGTFKDRAKYTLPWPLQLKRSKVPRAGLGVWSDAHLPKGLVFGPYEGCIATSFSSGEKIGYSWAIYRSGCDPFYIDACDPSFSNWLRYVNCGRNASENNLEAFQYLGQIYYKTIRPIQRGSELMVWYGDEYGKELGILRDSKNWHSNSTSTIAPCDLCGTHFRHESEFFYHRCLSKRTTTPKAASDPLRTQVKKRGRPRKIKDTIFSSAERLRKTPSSGLNSTFMTITPTEKKSLGIPEIDENETEKDMPSWEGFEENRNSSSGGSALFSPRRTRGTSRKAAGLGKFSGEIICKSRNKAIKSVRPRGRPPREKSNWKEASGSSEKSSCGTNFTRTLSPAEKNQKGKMIITNFRKPLKRIKIPLRLCKLPKESEKDNETTALPEYPFFPCHTCHATCEDHLGVLKHDLNHFQSFPLQCGLCQARFKTFHDLSRHLLCLNPLLFECRGSDMVSSFRKSDRMCDTEASKLMTCKECKTLLKHTKNLLVILKSHLIGHHGSGYTDLLNDYNHFAFTKLLTTEETTFETEANSHRCPICFEAPVDLKDAKKHLEAHVAFDSIQRCNLCYAWFPSVASLDEHTKCHEHCLKLLQKACDKIKVVDMINKLPSSLLSRLQLQLTWPENEEIPCHSLRVAEEKGEPLQTSLVSAENCLRKSTETLPKKKEALCCKSCKKFFDDQVSLKEHKTLCHKKVLNCKMCNSTFDSPLLLKQHKLSHKVPSPCKVCNKTFQTVALLKKHKKIHRKHITYDCKVCQKAFRTKSTYLFHIFTHGSDENQVKSIPRKESDFAAQPHLQHQRQEQQQQHEPPARHNTVSPVGVSQKGVCIRITVQDAVLDSQWTTASKKEADALASGEEFPFLVSQPDKSSEGSWIAPPQPLRNLC